MSKLQKEIDAVLEGVRRGAIKVAKLEEEPKYEDTGLSGGLRKLAQAMRSSSSEPTYQDIYKFLGEDTK